VKSAVRRRIRVDDARATTLRTATTVAFLGVAPMISLSRWRAKHLLGAWLAYWIVLLAVTASPALVAAFRAINSSAGHGKIDVSSDGGSLVAHITGDGVSWSGSTSLTSMALWIAGPPLLLWLVWLLTRRAPAPAPESERYRVS
jgi:hypothetical protein